MYVFCFAKLQKFRPLFLASTTAHTEKTGNGQSEHDLGACVCMSVCAEFILSSCQRAKVIFSFSLLCIPQQLCAELREAIIALKASQQSDGGLHAAFQWKAPAAVNTLLTHTHAEKAKRQPPQNRASDFNQAAICAACVPMCAHQSVFWLFFHTRGVDSEKIKL